MSAAHSANKAASTPVALRNCGRSTPRFQEARQLGSPPMSIAEMRQTDTTKGTVAIATFLEVKRGCNSCSISMRLASKPIRTTPTVMEVHVAVLAIASSMKAKTASTHEWPNTVHQSSAANKARHANTGTSQCLGVNSSMTAGPKTIAANINRINDISRSSRPFFVCSVDRRALNYSSCRFDRANDHFPPHSGRSRVMRLRPNRVSGALGHLYAAPASCV